MKIGSAFTGIAGMEIGFELAGLPLPAWMIENDKRKLVVLRRNYEGVPIYEDITQLSADDLARVDCLCGGFPCQDVSVQAGLAGRLGLAGDRSGLFFHFGRIIDSHCPTWIVIENVVGLLSSNAGRDMGTILAFLADRGYGYAYRVLDAQYFGVPQQRRRVYIVGHLRDWSAPARVLFEPNCFGWHPPATRNASLEDFPKTSRCLTAGGRQHGGQIYNPSVETYVYHDLEGVGEVPRRFSPVERERLQGFPDNWTADLVESARAHALGDAQNVYVATWLGMRIKRVHENS